MMGGGSAVRTAQTFYDDKAALSDDRDYSCKAQELTNSAQKVRQQIFLLPSKENGD